MIVSIYAKCRMTNQLYKIELDYKDNGRFILRPCGWWRHHFEQFVLESAESIKANYKLLPIVGVQ